MTKERKFSELVHGGKIPPIYPPNTIIIDVERWALWLTK